MKEVDLQAWGHVGTYGNSEKTSFVSSPKNLDLKGFVDSVVSVSWRQLASVRESWHVKTPCFDVPRVGWRQLASVRKIGIGIDQTHHFPSVGVS